MHVSKYNIISLCVKPQGSGRSFRQKYTIHSTKLQAQIKALTYSIVSEWKFKYLSIVFFLEIIIFTARKWSCGQVMFSEVFVYPQGGPSRASSSQGSAMKGGWCCKGGAMKGGSSRGVSWRGGCHEGGGFCEGVVMKVPLLVNKRAVHILLELFLVDQIFLLLFFKLYIWEKLL